MIISCTSSSSVAVTLLTRPGP